MPDRRARAAAVVAAITAFASVAACTSGSSQGTPSEEASSEGVPPPGPSATVDPDTGLNERVHVAVEAEGFRPGDNVRIVQCLAGADPFEKPRRRPCDRGEQSEPVDGHGELRHRRGVRRYVQDGSGGRVDCADEAGTCVISLASYEHHGDATELPLDFDPDAPFPDPPSVVVQPRRGLVDGQTVTVVGDDFNARHRSAVVQCVRGFTGLNRCFAPATFVRADVDGRVRTAFTVAREASVTGDRTPTDCGRVECVIRVVNLFDILGETAETPPLEFLRRAATPG